MTINFSKISFAEGVVHLQGKKIVPKPGHISTINYNPGEYPKDYWPEITYFNDGSCMACASNWEKDYYGDINACAPLWYLGEITEEN